MADKNNNEENTNNNNNEEKKEKTAAEMRKVRRELFYSIVVLESFTSISVSSWQVDKATKCVNGRIRMWLDISLYGGTSAWPCIIIFANLCIQCS